MTDLEMTKLCAEAMGYSVDEAEDTDLWPQHSLYWAIHRTNVIILTNDHGGYAARYDPLHDDAQAMALVKKFRLWIGYSKGWSAQKRNEDGDAVLQSGTFHYQDLNRAIVECVARMQKAKHD